MADDAQSIRSLNWRELFPIVNLFRAFRVAIHPSKLVLGFALVCLIYGGGRVLDFVWPHGSYAVSNEVDIFESVHFTQTAQPSFDKVLDDLHRRVALLGGPNVDDASLNPPRPVFDVFFEYEVRQFHQVIKAAVAGDWLNGSSPVLHSVANFAIIGPSWMLRHHFVYFLLFTSWFLVIWAIFGGAIARIAAVHVARDEKISIRQALRFGSSKLLSFVFAPLIPLIIVLIIGLVIAVGGLLMYIPVLGPIIVGGLFILALLAGLVITLVVVGTVGGFNLMYPTIAVEGSDSFDAISRSLSYVFARPWRMLIYTIVSLVYGGLCFMFVRFFVYLMLAFTHFFAQWFLGGKPGLYWPEIWPPVGVGDLTYHIHYHALAWSEKIAATLIAMWVYLVLSFLAAFVISFYFSSNTLIYFLMRREVDATELDDVFIEDNEDDFTEPGPTTPVPASSPAGTTPPDVAPVT
jgi:hypothetical protein